jgi:hypothetical protein
MNNVWRHDASYFADQKGLLPEVYPTLELGIKHYGQVFRAEVDRIMSIVNKEAAAEA